MSSRQSCDPHPFSQASHRGEPRDCPIILDESLDSDLEFDPQDKASVPSLQHLTSPASSNGAFLTARDRNCGDEAPDTCDDDLDYSWDDDLDYPYPSLQILTGLQPPQTHSFSTNPRAWRSATPITSSLPATSQNTESSDHPQILLYCFCSSASPREKHELEYQLSGQLRQRMGDKTRDFEEQVRSSIKKRLSKLPRNQGKEAHHTGSDNNRVEGIYQTP